MKATADIQVVPIGSGVSVRQEVQRAHQISLEVDIGAQLHPNGSEELPDGSFAGGAGHTSRLS